ncbi:terpene synthase family protein [Brasilonema sp. UFV-L1]
METLKNTATVNELSGIPAVDRAHVLQTALSIYPEVENWVAQFPVILPQRIAAVCLALTATAPYVQPSVIVKASILSLIIYAVDDLVDITEGFLDMTLTVEQMEAMLTLYVKLVQSSANSTYRDYPDLIKVFPTINESQPWVQIANALTKFCQELQKFPAAAIYYSTFAKHFKLGLEAMLTELYWSQAFKETGTYPTYEQYLLNGRKSIAAPLILSALLAMVGEPVDSEFSLKPPYANLETLIDEMMLTSSCGMRLANDIRSFERERQAQKPNSLLILMMTQGLSQKEAEAIVLKEMDTYLQKMEEPISLLPFSLSVWGDCTKRMTWFTCAWYQTREFHDFTKQMLAALR